MVIDSMDQSVDAGANKWDKTEGESMDYGKPLPSLMSASLTGPSTVTTKPSEEVWVENKTADARVYYYNARTRESSWTKPIATAGVKVITQDDVERMAAVNNKLQQAANGAKPKDPAALMESEIQMNSELTKSPQATTPVQETPSPVAPITTTAPPGVAPFTNGPPPFMAGGPPGMMPPAAAGGVNGPPPGFPPFMPPPGGFPAMPGFPGMPPFGMPGMPGMPPFGMPGMPPFGMMPFGGAANMAGLDEAKYFYSEETKKEIKEVEAKLASCKDEAASITEHEAPDGKKYYYNTKTNASVWEKPACMTDVAVLESKLETLKANKIEKRTLAEATKKAAKSAAAAAAVAAASDNNKESELSEEEKAKQRSKPISSTAVPGTPWCVVWTRDKRVFFYNPSEKVSLWERPTILVGRLDVDKLVKEPPAGAVADLAPGGGAAASTNVSHTSNNSSPNSNSNVNNSNVKKKSSNLIHSEPPLKKHKLIEDENESKNGHSKSPGSNSPHTDKSISPCASPSRQITEEFLQKEKIEASKEAALEAEHKAAQVRKELPMEQRVEQFKEMLIEKEISAYSTWEKELQKIVFDPRYLLLTSKERKQVFERYVRDRATEESKERATALKRKKDDYRELLKEAGISQKSSFTDFSIKYARDERFKCIEKMKERESLFNEYQSDLRKQEKEEKYAEREKLKKAFICLLKEQKNLHRSSSWSETKKQLDSESRYRAIESSSRREDYFRDYVRYLDDNRSYESPSNESDKKSSNHKDRDNREHKESKHKKSDKHDKSDRDDKAGSDLASASESGAIEDTDEEMVLNDEEKRKEKEKQERIEASLNQRNKEVKEQMSKIHSEREKERDQLKLDETLECFRALLLDIIKPNMDKGKSSERADNGDAKSSSSSKTGEIGWKEAKKILKRDSRWSYCKALDKDKKEQLFDEHMAKLRSKKRELFYQLLDDTQGVTLSSTWKEVKKLIKSDARYEKLQQSDTIKMEKEFDNYISEKYQTAKKDFNELLMQTKLITHKSMTLTSEGPQHLKEIEDILSKDKSWIVMECAADERKKLIEDYMQKLNVEGPPPPPTATEPSRRK